MIKHGLSNNLLKSYLIGSIILLLVLTGINFFQFRSFSESQKLIIKSHDIQTELQKLLVNLMETETSQRSFLISKDSAFFSNYKKEKSEIQPILDNIKGVIQDQGQQARLDTLQHLVDSRIAYLERTLIYFAESQEKIIEEEISLSFIMVYGNRLLNLIKTNISLISHHEAENLKERENRRNQNNWINPILWLLTVLFALFVFILAYFVLNSYLNKVKKSLYKLQLNHEIYEQVERISDSGHWYFYPESSNIIFSDNYYRLLGYEPGSFQPTLRKYFSTICVSDRPAVIHSLKQLKKDGLIPPINLKIMTPEGKEKNIHLVATLIMDDEGKNIIIGANKDQTKEFAYQENLNRLNSALQVQNNIFKNAESIADTGSSAYYEQTGMLEFSDNLYRLLGHAPDDFRASQEKLLEFVHPQDLPKIRNSLGLMATHITQGINNFRIIDRSGGVKFITSNKKNLEERDLKILVVTFKDVTEEVMISKRLEEKNRELVKTNDELDSFNHIASHDLQEPLRKIQTFISRLMEMEDLKLTSTYPTYLARIQAAAKRMQSLILDLLAFSRIAKDVRIFQHSNLKSILEVAIQELSQEVEEKKAVFHIEDLSEAEVVPFQFQQLFLNLISNSLKYSKEESEVIIRIKREPLVPEDIEKYFFFDKKDVVKITFEDNGIGFDQKYADKIFILFQRLHENTQYSGTGIGLSICKKIMENHHGYISAVGIPGKGSKFTLIFPKSQKESIYIRPDFQPL